MSAARTNYVSRIVDARYLTSSRGADWNAPRSRGTSVRSEDESGQLHSLQPHNTYRIRLCDFLLRFPRGLAANNKRLHDPGTSSSHCSRSWGNLIDLHWRQQTHVGQRRRGTVSLDHRSSAVHTRRLLLECFRHHRLVLQRIILQLCFRLPKWWDGERPAHASSLWRVGRWRSAGPAVDDHLCVSVEAQGAELQYL